MTEQLEQYHRDNFETLCKSYAGRVGGLYNAEDVIQEAFTRALRYWSTYDPNKSSLSTWFGKIARRAMYDFRAEETREGMTREELSQEEEPSVTIGELGAATMNGLEKEIETYSRDRSEILHLAIIKGYRPREIVEVVDQSPSVVRKLLENFRTDMKEKYGDNSGTKESS